MSFAAFKQNALNAISELESQVAIYEQLIDTHYQLTVVINRDGEDTTVTLCPEVKGRIQTILTNHYSNLLDTARAEFVRKIVGALHDDIPDLKQGGSSHA